MIDKSRMLFEILQKCHARSKSIITEIANKTNSHGNSIQHVTFMTCLWSGYISLIVQCISVIKAAFLTISVIMLLDPTWLNCMATQEAYDMFIKWLCQLHNAKSYQSSFCMCLTSQKISGVCSSLNCKTKTGGRVYFNSLS